MRQDAQGASCIGAVADADVELAKCSEAAMRHGANMSHKQAVGGMWQ